MPNKIIDFKKVLGLTIFATILILVIMAQFSPLSMVAFDN
jgi:hypothetical protein